jgi:hypothetical protein
MRFLEAFAANMRNPHTHRAYVQAVEEISAWCAAAAVDRGCSAGACRHLN